MLIAGFDTETTGLNVKEDHIVQVGVVLWDTESAKKKAKMKFDAVIKGEHIREIPAKAAESNGLSMADVEKYGCKIQDVFTCLHQVFARCDAIMAFNGDNFDRPIYEENCKRHGIEPVAGKLWIDAMTEVPYPSDKTARRLTYLASEHGFVNPFPHDAISDVLTMLKIADLYDWNRIVEMARTPTYVVQAVMPFTKDEMFSTRKEEFKVMKDRVKENGFFFDFETKTWSKRVKEFDRDKVKEIAREAGYTLKLIRKEVKA